MNIFLLTALTASGKTTITKAVSKECSIPVVDLHEILRGFAYKRGKSRAREWVAEVGLEEAIKLSREKMIQDIRDSENPRGVLVDEVIDQGTLSEIQESFPLDRVRIIHICVSEQDRISFVTERIGAGSLSEATEEIKFIDGLKNMAGIQDVIRQADVRVDNCRGDLDSAIGKVRKIICDGL